MNRSRRGASVSGGSVPANSHRHGRERLSAPGKNAESFGTVNMHPKIPDHFDVDRARCKNTTFEYFCSAVLD
jgi:hypothetical protein